MLREVLIVFTIITVTSYSSMIALSTFFNSLLLLLPLCLVLLPCMTAVASTTKMYSDLCY